jgi:surface protein
MESEFTQSQPTTLNPFELLHTDLHELIFQHFTFSDIFKFSVVSHKSFEDSSSSPSCMRRINVNADRLLAMGIESPVTRRPYQSISLTKYRDPSVSSKLVKILRSLGHCRWKSVTLTGIEFKKNDLIEVLERSEATLEELVITRCVILQFPEETIFSFKKLKALNLSDCSPLEPGGAEQNIELFRQRHRIKQHNARLLGKAILRNCKNLEELTLGNWDTYYITNDSDLDLIRFQLKKLEIQTEPHATFDRDAYCQFMRRTCQRLEHLTISGGRVRNALLETIFRLPLLESLKITRMILTDPVQLQVNPSITRLHLVYKNLPVEHQEIILTNTPNLKFLSIHTINNDNINMIAEKCSRLESLSVAYLWIPHGNYFQNLKQLEIAADVPYVLEQRIRQTPEAQRTPLDRLILNAI